MYRHLHHDIILSPRQETAARPTHADGGEEFHATADRHHPRIRRLVAIAAIGVSVAATTVMTIGGAGANPAPEGHGSHVTAPQLQREMGALRATGFVATSCRVDGTLMTNYRTHRSVLVRW